MYKIKPYKIIVQLIRVDDSWNGCCVQDIEKIETLAHVKYIGYATKPYFKTSPKIIR